MSGDETAEGEHLEEHFLTAARLARWRRCGRRE